MILLGALLSVFPLILRAPQVGILAWILVTLMNPQREVFGFLSTVQLNLIIALVTLFAWIFSKERKVATLNPLTMAILLFGVWVSVTTYLALDPNFSYPLWIRLLKTLVLAIAIITIITTKARIQAVVWMIVLSLGYFGVKGGGFVLLTAGRYHVYGPEDSMIRDNNSLGLALVMLLPLINYLRLTTRSRLVSLCGLAIMGFTIIAIIGTYSRGALVALGAAGLAYVAKSRSSLVPLVLGAMVLTALPSLVPSDWFERMATIKTANQDESFDERLQAWKSSMNIAEARPITGGGFSAIERTSIVQQFHSPGSLDIGRASHSIYFQVLSDHGFVGLVLYLFVIAAAWLNTSVALKLTADRPDLEWANRLTRMIQISMISYLVGGAALSMAYYDGFLIILFLTAALVSVAQLARNDSKTFIPRWKMAAPPMQEPQISLPGPTAQNPA